jgi:hypothetical protein
VLDTALSYVNQALVFLLRHPVVDIFQPGTIYYRCRIRFRRMVCKVELPCIKDWTWACGDPKEILKGAARLGDTVYPSLGFIWLAVRHELEAGAF